MKNLIIHSIPVAASMIWLEVECGTLNPLSLKGPDFLKFYSILFLGFYASVVVLKLLNETISKTTLYGIMLIFVLGVVKLTRGIILGKPVGFLFLILILEGIVGLFLMSQYGKKKMK
ncbi:hypothetical protein [Chryseobacterium pennipullorum]|uniref:DUF4345 domain-containing protein n=1 Tax=Chryseobacterium pennipullorum TaxID=2258963 RepID=A0A3D9AK72_9FLAO|nr:hypothetical protein [Chryseobacterium pennipullorum]REC41743.1 hypothetical protein DRF67_21115 [Chryseobacterium pennipullorum]